MEIICINTNSSQDSYAFLIARFERNHRSCRLFGCSTSQFGADTFNFIIQINKIDKKLIFYCY